MPARKVRWCMARRMFLGTSGAALASSLLRADAQAVGASGFDRMIRAQMAAAQIPGLAVGIAKEGRMIAAQGYGFADLASRRPVTPETMFHIASITKTVTASAVMLLVDEGRIALDDPVAPHLDFTIAGEHAARITFRHLLMHTSGISDEIYYEVDFRTPGADSPLALEILLLSYLAPGGRYTAAGNVKRVPGTHWDYSNIGYALLGHLAGRIAGKDLRVFTRERLFEPLGLEHIAWTLADTAARLRATPYDLTNGVLVPVEPVGFPDWPAGMIRASVGDLTRLVSTVANGGAAQAKRLLSATDVSEMITMHQPLGLPEWLTGQGLAWQQSLLDGTPRVNHWGGDPGVFTMAYLDPVRHTGVVVLANISATPQSRDALKAIASLALDSGPR